MIKNRNETSAAMDKALKNLEQAKARYDDRVYVAAEKDFGKKWCKSA